MSLNHQLSERNGQNNALKKQQKVAFQKKIPRESNLNYLRQKYAIHVYIMLLSRKKKTLNW